MPLEDPEGETKTHDFITTSFKSLKISVICFMLILFAFNSLASVFLSCLVYRFYYSVSWLFSCNLFLFLFMSRNMLYSVLHHMYNFNLLVYIELLSVLIVVWWIFPIYLIPNRIFIETIVMELSYYQRIKY